MPFTQQSCVYGAVSEDDGFDHLRFDTKRNKIAMHTDIYVTASCLHYLPKPFLSSPLASSICASSSPMATAVLMASKVLTSSVHLQLPQRI